MYTKVQLEILVAALEKQLELRQKDVERLGRAQPHIVDAVYADVLTIQQHKLNETACLLKRFHDELDKLS